jgi:energy-converting hydrogenase Eha subunit A
MNLVVVLLFGGLIFLATILVSIPFGFVEGFAKAKGKPISESVRSSWKLPERVLEAAGVAVIFAGLAKQQPSAPALHCMGAALSAALISYFIEVRRMGMPIKELFCGFSRLSWCACQWA